jgi:hypothetical protein
LYDYFCWKTGGDGDNGETLMYQMDAFFELFDLENPINILKEAIEKAIPCLDTDSDLSDEQIQGTYPELIARRSALRLCQQALQTKTIKVLEKIQK